MMSSSQKKMKKMTDVAFRSISIRVPTPDGTMYVNILEDDSYRACKVLISIGKAGASVSAWADAVGRLISKLLELGAGINFIIDELSALNTDRVAIDSTGEEVRSGPDGLALALMKYRTGKFQELKENLGVNTDAQSAG